jgi:signal transduction histidine kinase
MERVEIAWSSVGTRIPSPKSMNHGGSWPRRAARPAAAVTRPPPRRPVSDPDPAAHRAELLAKLSHELRTPLNSILVLSKLLLDDPKGLGERQRACARTIHAASADLEALIDDVLDLSRVESGTMHLDLAEVVIADIAGWAEESFRQLATEKGIALRVVLEPALPRALVTDGKRVKQVLRNLLANALKFTSRGSITLACGDADGEPASVADAAGVVAFTVTDTGVGIPLDEQDIIFEAFKQTRQGVAHGGSGLGLSISSQVARLLGGDVEVQSALGRGSTFTFYLPRVHPSLGAIAPPHPSSVPGDDETPRASRRSR